MATKNHIVHICELDQFIEVSHGDNLLDNLIIKKIRISHSCGGNGTCGTCLIKIENSDLISKNIIENEFLMDRGYGQDLRLACQIEVDQKITIGKIFNLE